MPEEISLSIAETNKLRLKLGLKPIPEQETETINERQTGDRADNVEINGEVGIIALKEAAPNEPPRKRLKGADRDMKSRIDVDSFLADVPESTDDWLASLGSKIVPNNVKTEPNNQNHILKQQDTDDSRIKVAHNAKELGSLKENEILTLKDGSIFDENSNQLSNSTLTEKKELKDRLKEQIKVENIKLYGRDVDLGEESEEDETFVTSNEIRLTNEGENGSAEGSAEGSAAGVDHYRKKKVALVDLFAELDGEEEKKNNHQNVTSKKSKKIKKIKKKDNVSKKASVPAEKIEVVSIENDDLDDFNDTLESFLSNKRQLKQLKRKLLTPEQIAEEIRAKEMEETQNQLENEVLSYRDSQKSVFDDTTDFLNKLTAERRENVGLDDKKTPETIHQAHLMNEKQNDQAFKKSNGSSNEESVEKREKNSEEDVHDELPTGAELEKKINFGGLASTLKYLQQESGIQTNNIDRTRAKKYRDAQREADKLKLQVSIERRILTEELAKDKAYMNTERKEREKLFEKYLHQRLTEKHILTEERKNDKTQNLLHYNPEVSIKYKDEEGNQLTAKQAYKELSHKFHGNKPNGGKKRLTKQATRNSNIIG